MEKIHENVIKLLVITAVILATTAFASAAAADSNTALIKPDYSGITIPPNIGPMNFTIIEKAKKYRVKISAEDGKPITIKSSNGEIKIPAKKWNKLLNANKGKQLQIEIEKLKDNKWSTPEIITNTIATDNIDSFVAYRMMNPIYNFSKNTPLYQYDIENLKESALFDNRRLGRGCVNCHSFSDNNPEKMLMGVRSGVHGSSTILAEGKNAKKLDAKFGHTAWHPSEKIVAYSMYNVKQFFHSARTEVRDVIELDSAILYYDFEKNIAKTIPQLSDKDQLETHPIWSPDGKYLYFASAEKHWPGVDKLPPDNYDKTKYDIKRIAYDIATDKWGQLETVISSKDTGRSSIFPRFAPDGKSLIFVMCNYSCFSLFHPDADLWLLDIATGSYRPLEAANSDQAESWHSVSTNSRWIIFSSKRHEGTFTKLYISYLTDDGRSTKAFILPQKDPAFYDTFAKCYNVPEFITGPVKTPQAMIEKAMKGTEKVDIVSPITAASPDVKSKNAWQQGLD